MKTNMKKNVITTGLAVTLAAAMVIGGGTVAYLQGQTKDVVNEFKTNKVMVSLTESGADPNTGVNNTYEIIPGTEAAKDPKVTVDNTVAAYVYVRVTDDTQELVGYEIADDWNLLEGFTDVYYREVPAKASASDADAEFAVLKDNKVYYDAALENSDMLSADGNLKDGIKLSFKAFAIQKTPFEDPMLAYGYAAGTAVANKTEIENAVKTANEVGEPAVLLINGGVDLNETLTIRADNGLTLVGDGMAAVTGKPIHLYVKEEIVISGIDFNNGTLRDDVNGPQESSIYVSNKDEIKNLVIENCSFTESGWDCIQLTNPNIESIAIRGNSFINTDKSNPGKRYIHLELRDANGQYTASDTKLEITGNTFTNVSESYCDDSAVTVCGFKFENMTIERNAVLGDGADKLTTAIIWICNGTNFNELYSTEQIKAAFVYASAAVSTEEEMNEAIANVKDGDVIVLTDDIAVTAPLNFSGNSDGTSETPVKANLNLNGNIIFAETPIWNDSQTSSDWSLISVGSGVELTIDGSGSLEAIPEDSYAVDVWGGGKLTINGGTYIGNIHAVYVLEGELVVNGGTFSVQQKYSTDKPDEFVLNCYDANYKDETAKITVNGGSFAGFNPSDCKAEGVGTNFTAEGCTVSAATGADGITWYTVTPNAAAE